MSQKDLCDDFRVAPEGPGVPDGFPKYSLDVLAFSGLCQSHTEAKFNGSVEETKEEVTLHSYLGDLFKRWYIRNGSLEQKIVADPALVGLVHMLQASSYDYTEHVSKAVSYYRANREKYENFRVTIEGLVKQAIKNSGIRYDNIYSRLKTEKSFRNKAGSASSEDPRMPRFMDPAAIKDIVGVRVIGYSLREIDSMAEVIHDAFEVVREIDKSEELLKSGLVGYRSIHYVVKLPSELTSTSIYRVYAGLEAEIQIRTVLQHAWAEIEHEQYKAAGDSPPDIRQGFANLAGALTVADEAFQGVIDRAAKIGERTKEAFDDGDWDEVAVTSEYLRKYASWKFARANEMTRAKCDHLVRLLISMGIVDIRKLHVVMERCGDATKESIRRRWDEEAGNPDQGDLIEDVLLVCMKEAYFQNHPYANARPWKEMRMKHRERMMTR